MPWTCRLGRLIPVLTLALAVPVQAEDPPEPGRVPLDALLRLPHGPRPGAAPSRDANERERWVRRFDTRRAELDGARRSLAEAQAELEELAAGNDSWQIAAPGAQPSAENSPLSYRLREEIRRRREAVSRAERSLLELEAEAGLAGVPTDWRRPPEAAEANAHDPGDG